MEACATEADGRRLSADGQHSPLQPEQTTAHRRDAGATGTNQAEQTAGDVAPALQPKPFPWWTVGVSVWVLGVVLAFLYQVAKVLNLL